MLSPQVTSIIVAIASSLGTSSPAREPVSLAYKWPVNQTVSYRITQDGNQKVSGMPMPDATQTVHQVSTLELTPKSVADDGAATIEAVYSAISLDLQPMMDKTKYSFDSAASAEDAQNPLAGPVKAVVGQKFTVVLGPDGAVRKIDGFQAIADKSGEATTPAASRMAPLLKGTFSEQAVNKFFEVAFHRLPASPVEPGGSWTTTYDSAIPQMGTMTATGQSTLTSLDAGAATIDTTVAMALKPPANGEAVNPMMKNMTLEGAGGTVRSVFDAEKGLLRQFSGKVSMPFKSSNPPSGNAQQMNISIDVESATGVELLDTK